MVIRIASDARATDISQNTSATFSIEDDKSIGITLSNSNIVLNIQPSSTGTFASTSMTVDVSTNNTTGYTLTMTADKTSLSRTSDVNGVTPTIPTIPTGKTFTETNFETGYWGYKLGTATDYLPMTTSTIPVNTTEEAANSSVSTITFASKLDNSIPTGTYSGITLSFVATTNETPLYIQDVDLTTCKVNVGTNGNAANVGDEIDVTDARDGKTYKVRYINGACWMTQNLRFLGNKGSASGKMTLTSGTSNGANATIDLYSLASSKNATNAALGDYANHCDTNNGYNYACVYDSGSETTGVWYNYYAATAGNISGSSNSTAVSASGPSVCPAGWHLPTGAADNESSELYKLFQTVSNSWITNNYLAAFNSSVGGRYINGSIGNAATNGFWWSASANDASSRYHLYNYSSAGNTQFRGGSDGRFYGYFIRCVHTGLEITSEWLASNNFTIASRYLEYFNRTDSDSRVLVATKDGTVVVNGESFDLKAGDLITATPGTYSGLDVGERLLIAKDGSYTVNYSYFNLETGNIIVGADDGAYLDTSGGGIVNPDIPIN